MNTDGRLTPEVITGKAFKKVRHGYSVSEVDRFLAKVAEDLARLREHARRGTVPVEPLLTPEEVERKTFGGTWRGYAMPPVDEFLDEIVSELRRAHDALVEAEQWRSASTGTSLQLPLQSMMRPLSPAEPFTRNLTARDVASKVFRREPHGYRVEEVDQFLGFVAVELARIGGDAAAQPRLTAQDIAARRFTLALRGYAMHEVDDFLARVATQLAERQSGRSTTG